MQKITTHLWFDGQAEEAARLYVDAFEDSGLGRITRYDAAMAEAAGRPEGSVLTVDFELEGQGFVALNGGPRFRFTPAVSLFVSCRSAAEIDRLFGTLSDGGTVLMPLQAYPFSERFVWFADRFGVSWQLNLAVAEDRIAPALLFVGDQHGKAEEAMRLYTSLFDDSEIRTLERYGPDDGDPAVGAVRYGEFTLHGQTFRAMDSSLAHAFTFTEAVSFQVTCEDQAEVDRLWDALTAEGEEQPCGWLKDRFGVSWQIEPAALLEMLQDEDRERAGRVTRAMLGMTRIRIDELEAAYAGGK